VTSSKRLQYVNRWQLSGSPQPFVVYGSYMWGFVFRANMSSLQRLVDSQLNQDPSGRVSYAPLVPFVLFSYSSLDYIQPKFPPWLEVGGSYEYELAVWVPIRRCGELTLMLFAPYIFVNNPLAVLQGRELYGFAKEFAQIPKKGHWPDEFPVSAFVLAEHGGGHAPTPRYKRVVSVERVRDKPLVRERRDWTSMWQAATELRREFISRTAFPGLAYLPPLLGSFWPPNARCAFRKQFPDCHDPKASSYRGVVETNLKVSYVDYGYLLKNDYELRLPSDSSHPLARELGLRDGSSSLLSYELKFAFEIEAGREMWRAPAPGETSPWWLQLYDVVTCPPRKFVDLGVAAAQTIVLSRKPKSEVDEPLPEPSGEKQRIAILGGGPGALAAAFALTRVPNWQDHFDITVYQMGWRLGGKGASGRHQGHHDRIEEHGIHIWFGFYENAFRMMRECYRALGDIDYSSYEDPILWGFERYNLAVIERSLQNGKTWEPVQVSPPNFSIGGWPGDDPNREIPSTPWEFARAMVRFLLSYLFDPGVAERLAEVPAELKIEPATAALFASADLALGDDEESRTHPANLFARLADFLDTRMPWGDFTSLGYRVAIGGLWSLIDWLRARLEPYFGTDTLVGRLWTMLDLGLTAVLGIVADGVVFGGFKIIDHLDFAEWLGRWGARETTLKSEWVRALYSQSFAFENGDTAKPRAAAGTLLRGVGRMLFTYRRAFLFKMRSGMGDVVFAPLYRYLEQRDVKFRFFHRVKELRLSDDKKSIASIVFARQATPKDTKKGYEPLVKVNGLWCWPNKPDLTQLVEEQQIKDIEEQTGFVNFESAWSGWGPYEKDWTLNCGGQEGFDKVILGIPIGSMHSVCSALEVQPRWAEMVQKVKTLRTQAFQLWLNRSIDEIGWPADLVSDDYRRHPPRQGPVLTAFKEPIDTWGDLSQTIQTETWPAGNTPKQVAYFCGPKKDDPDEPQPYTKPSYPLQVKAEVLNDMLEFLVHDVHHLWPTIAGNGSFDWDALVVKDPASGVNRARQQFWIANIDPSERYVLSLPGTTSARIRSDSTPFSNLLLAGDWTLNGMNASCIEAAVMSGMRAARALGGWPNKILGEDHFDAEFPPEWPRLETEFEPELAVAAGGER